MFGHSAMMYRHAFYAPDGTGGGNAQGEFTDPGDVGGGEGGQLDDPEGQPGGEDGDDPGQRRTSKQPPELDAAFAEARRAKQRAEQLERELAELQQKHEKIMTPYKKYGLHTEDDIVNTIAAEEQRRMYDNSRIVNEQQAALQQEVSRLQQMGYDEVIIATRVDAMQARFDAINERREREQERERRRQERELEQAQRQEQAQAERVKQYHDHWYSQYKELRKDFPDLLPAKAGNFLEVAQAMPDVVKLMASDNLDFRRAFKDIHEDAYAERRYKKKLERDAANDERSTSSGRGGGDYSGASYGLTAQQQQLAKEGGISYKEYAALLKHVKK